MGINLGFDFQCDEAVESKLLPYTQVRACPIGILVLERIKNNPIAHRLT
jgi:hypothetical protein